MLTIYTSESLNPTVLELDLRADIYFILRSTTRASGMEMPPFFVTFTNTINKGKKEMK
jgi:hypothetical protein